MPKRAFLRSDETLFRTGTGLFAVLLTMIVVAIGIELLRESQLSIKAFGGVLANGCLGSGGRRIRCPAVHLGHPLFVDPRADHLDPDRARDCHLHLRARADLVAEAARFHHGTACRDPLNRLWPLGRLWYVVPFVRQLQIATPDWMRSIPLFTGPPLGVGMLSAAVILAIMVIPFTSSIAREVLKAVPQAQREGAYALGATQWEAIRMALFYARTGIVGAVMLGFGRALGETMAVTMVIGTTRKSPLLSLRRSTPWRPSLPTSSPRRRTTFISMRWWRSDSSSLSLR